MEGVFLVPFAPFMFVLGLVWLNNRRKLEEKRIAAGINAADDSHLLRERDGRVDELEQRLRVLERIVTDRGYDVATQIEALRDQRRTAGQLEEPASRERI